MRLKIIGTESLGVRGLSCVVEMKNRKIFIDPGLALGYLRKGFMPHPVQIGVGEIVRKKILLELTNVTDIIFSHFHGDHIPLYDANPYQLSIEQVKKVLPDCTIWANQNCYQNEKMKKRAESIVLGLERNINEAQGQIDENLSFLKPVSHGENSNIAGKVTMSRIEAEGEVFLHASDIQFLSEDAVSEILACRPDIVLASGPPLYLVDYMQGRVEKAWSNALRLGQGVETLIIDHHLLRCEEGVPWLARLADLSGNKVICAADFMNFERHLLEAWREKMYKELPVPADWHRLYEGKEVETESYLKAAREKYDWFCY